MKKLDPVFKERLKKLICSMGYELVGCEYFYQGHRPALRVYIDSENGATVEDCSLVARQLGAMIDVEVPAREQPALEVSSPGVDRPLFEIEHYRRYIGRQVKIRLYLSVNQRRQYTGTLRRVEEGNIYLLLDDAPEEIKLPLSSIERANLIGDVHF